MIKGTLTGLRAVEREDLPLLRDWRNNPAFRRNFREVRELNMASQELWFQDCCLRNPNNFMFVIEDLETQQPIGACGLLYVNWIIRSADFSFYIGHQNLYIDSKGYAEDASKQLINYGFGNLNLNKIWMELYEFDEQKIHFYMTKFNFNKDGTLRENCYENGRFWDSVILSKLKTDSFSFNK